MRYFGGKTKIAKYISEYINARIHTHTHTHTHYAEPFCGSCNIAILVNATVKLLNDKHKYLIAMFQALQNGWIPPTSVSEQEYYSAKQNQDNEPWIAGFVGFACSFAGKWWGGYARDNKGGNYALRGHNSVLKKMKALSCATFTSQDFQELNYENCLVYCDPPYKNTTQYCKSILGNFPYENFLQWTKKMSEKNIVLVSEYKHNVPDGAKIVLEIPSRTSIRDKSGNVIETTEVLWEWVK
jgi:DNA adenine methylase